MKTWEEYRTSLIKHGKECVLQNRLLVETRQKELEAWMQKAFAQFAHTISDKKSSMSIWTEILGKRKYTISFRQGAQ